MITIAIITAVGELHIHDVSEKLSVRKVENFIVEHYGNNCNWQVITKTENHCKDKPKYYVSVCPDTKRQFLVEYQKDGNIIELTSDNITAIKKISSQDKTFIFLTVDGTAKDEFGEESVVQS